MRGGDKDIGREIRTKRRELEMSQWELAVRVGVTQSHVSNIEHGYVTPDDDLLEAIRSILSPDTEAVTA